MKKENKTLTLKSPAFENMSEIPLKYSCESENISPPLTINKIDPKTKSLALIVEDPDAPTKTWTHWLLWNLSPTTTKIEENSIPSGTHQGTNDFQKIEYGGPCPPKGTHRYFFKLYALDTILNLPIGATKKDLLKAIENHIIDYSELIGLYTKR